jgi:hypothetical protein
LRSLPSLLVLPISPLVCDDGGYRGSVNGRDVYIRGHGRGGRDNGPRGRGREMDGGASVYMHDRVIQCRLLIPSSRPLRHLLLIQMR